MKSLTNGGEVSVISAEATFIKEHAKDLVVYITELEQSSYPTSPTLHTQLIKTLDLEIRKEENCHFQHRIG